MGQKWGMPEGMTHMDLVTCVLLGHKQEAGEKGVVWSSAHPVLCESSGVKAKGRGGAYPLCTTLHPPFARQGGVVQSPCTKRGNWPGTCQAEGGREVSKGEMRGGGEGGHTCHVDGNGQGVGVGTHLHPHPVARGGQRQRGQGEGMSMQVQEGDETEGSFEKVIGNVVLNKWGLRGIEASS